MMGIVKSERRSEYDINPISQKILEQNRSALLQRQYQQQRFLANKASLAMASNGQPSIQNYMNGSASSSPITSRADMEENKIDEISRKGCFGWAEVDNNYVSYIFRRENGNAEKYASVRMLERKFLKKFLSVLPIEVNSCHCIRSYYITEIECRLLNEINIRHCDCIYGKEQFTSKDLVVRITDAEEFYRFLDLCYKKLVLKKYNGSDRCGFFRINQESVVPYTITGDVKYVPLFYFEGETDHLNLKSDEVSGWDLAYLKFCCKVQGIRNELFAADVCKVVALDEIKGHFPVGTTFEDYWPAKGSIEPVEEQKPCAGIWTQKPAVPVSRPARNETTHVSAANAAVAAFNNAAQLSFRQAVASSMSYSPLANYQQLVQRGSIMTPSVSNHHLLPATNGLTAAQQQLHAQQMQLLRHYDQAAAARAQVQPSSRRRALPWKLTQIKDFQIIQSPQPAYKLQKALIEQKIVPCVNVRPHVFQDLMMTLPDFVKHFFPTLSIDRARGMLQDALQLVIYKGNSGHQEVLRREGKCDQYDPVPLILVRDIMNYMQQMRYIVTTAVSEAATNSGPLNKRQKFA